MSRRNPDYSDEEEARGRAGRAVLERYADTIRTGMAEALWVLAYADWAEENPDEADEQLGLAKSGQDWADNALANGTPKAAEKAAADLYALYEKANGNLVELYGLAQEADMGETFEFASEGKDKRLDENWKFGDAHEFGQSFAAMAMGHGVGWFHDHKEFAYEKVSFECRYDGDELAWSGGTQDVREASQRIGRIIVVNDTSFYNRRYLLSFGQVSPTFLLIGADGLDSALDELIDWVAENEPNGLTNGAVEEEYHRLRTEGQSEEEAQENAQVGMTSGGNASDYINSDDWSIVAEDPTEDQIRAFAYGKNPADQFTIQGVTNPAPKKGTELREPWMGTTTIVVEQARHGISGWLESKGGHRIPISFGTDRPATLKQAMESAKKFLRRAQGAGGGMVNPAKKKNCATPNPTMAQLRDPRYVAREIEDGLRSEFAQKVASIDIKPDPMGRIKTLAEFQRDIANNLATGLMVVDDDE